MLVNIHNADTEYLKAMFGPACTSRPKLPDIRSLVARFGYVARINGYYSLARAFSESHIHQLDIELHPIKRVLVKLTEALFATVAIASHLGEIYLARYNHI